ncbi:MAG: sensory rhodopsin transducer [Pseudohongiella sp.]|nr:sensory rhodopsin transducer [Pseudohongiella sp.]
MQDVYPNDQHGAVNHPEPRNHPGAHGKTVWIIAEGYLPAPGPRPDNPALSSHEAACVLNTGDKTANLTITLFFTDREPSGPYQVSVPPRRTLHLRFDDLKDPEPVPRETDFASLVESDQPVVVQHTRLDARLGSLALMTTMAYGENR